MEEGLKILLKAFDWRNNEFISEEEFAVAKQAGYMFDYPAYETHDEALKRLERILPRIDEQDVANAFLYSLSTRKLEYRSILGSYYYAKAIPTHELLPSHNLVMMDNLFDFDHCYLCGWRAWRKEPREEELRGDSELNLYNYFRYKEGGCRHDRLCFALFDMEQFLKLPKVVPTEEDRGILRRILECAHKLESRGRAGKLREAISKEKIFPCNKDEISTLLGVLGICGILSTKDSPSYEELFPDKYNRDPIPLHKYNDFAYPVNRWCASDGINRERFERVFRYKLELGTRGSEN